MSYDSNNIQVYSDIEAIQKHPHIYVGDNEKFALYLVVKEQIENSLDEVAKNGTKVICARTDKGFIIYDDGRGIPVDSKKHGIPAIKLIFEKLNSGGKSNGEYGNSTIGVHGVGCAVSNALSKRLMAASWRDRKWHCYISARGKGKVGPGDIKTFPGYDLISNHISKKGTLVYVEPDLSWPIFENAGEIDDEQIKLSMKIASLSNPKRKYIYINLQDEEFIYQDEAKKLPKDSFKFFSDNLTVVMDKEPGDFKSFVCSTHTSEHGTHWQGFLKAYAEAIQPLVKKNQKFDIEDAINVSGMLNYSTISPSFSGQAKQKLKSKKALAEVSSALKEPLAQWVKKNRSHILEGIEHAVQLKNIEEKFEQEKTLEKSVAKRALPLKFLSCPYAKPEQREIFLLEGDSAAGPCKIARDNKYQEIWPVQGKILNVYKSFSKALNSEAVQNLLRVIGYSKDDPNLTKLRVKNKIILLTDSDADGAHIRLLIVGILWRFIPEAFHRGMVYYLDTPLYSYRSSTRKYFGNTKTELKENVTKAGEKYNPDNVTRAKGWGEVSPSHLKEIAFNSKTRKLVRIPPMDSPEAKKAFHGIIIDKDASYRARIAGLPVDSSISNLEDDFEEV